MTDNSVSTSDVNWSAYSASNDCSDFKAAVCSTGESGCDESEQACTTQTSDCSPSLSTTGFSTSTSDCGSLSTTGFSTSTSDCATLSTTSFCTTTPESCALPTTGFNVPTSSTCSLSTTGFNVPVENSCSLTTTGFQTNITECADLSVTKFSVTLPSCGCEDMTPVTTSCAPTLTVSGDSIDTGSYTITAGSSHDGSIVVTDNCTGQVVTQIWGDPHVDDASGNAVGIFSGNNLDITLPDGTRILMEPTAETNGVAHLANATVVSGSEAVTISGTNGSFTHGVTLSSVFAGGAAQNALYANGATELTLGTNGDLYVDTASGTEGQQVQASNGTSMNLDGLGGAPSSLAA